MRPFLPLALLCAALAAGAAAAETHEVRMLNRGEAGAMVFEPSFVRAAPGDVIRFVPTDRGHNVAAIEGMLPEGVEPFEGGMGEELSLTVTAEGLYGVQCTPHAAMGMVGLVQVGAPVNLEAAAEEAGRLRGKAEERMAADLALVE